MKNEFGLNAEQIRELHIALEEMEIEARAVKADYEKDPSNLDSGSVIVVHENSTLLQNKEEPLSDVAYNITRKYYVGYK